MLISPSHTMTGMNRGMVRSRTEGCLTRLLDEESPPAVQQVETENGEKTKTPPRLRSVSLNQLQWSEPQATVSVDVTSTSTTVETEDTAAPATPVQDKTLPKIVSTTTLVLDANDSVERLNRYLSNQEWQNLKVLLQENPRLAKERVELICQGEKVQSTVLHKAVSAHDHPCVTLDVVQAIVAAYPGSIWSTDSHGRLPLHVGLLKSASPSILQLLLQGGDNCRVVRHADDEDNTALNYALLYGTPDIALQICRAWPKALQLENKKHRLPLQVLAGVWSDLDEPSAIENEKVVTWMHVLDDMLERYPQAAWVSDPWGRLPLHILCEHVLVQVNVLEKMINLNPDALLVQDKANKRPLDCLLHHKTNNVVVQYVKERTKRQQGGRLFRWRNRKPNH